MMGRGFESGFEQADGSNGAECQRVARKEQAFFFQFVRPFVLLRYSDKLDNWFSPLFLQSLLHVLLP
jgi:hypothetical protein